MAKAKSTSNPAPSADEWDDAGTDTGSDEARRNAALSGSGIASAGPALTEDQLTGLDPIDAEKHLDEAARRAEMTNMQTEHEAAGGLDAVSGTPNPGVTEDQSRAHTQPGARGSDMSGRPPMGDPLAALDRANLSAVRTALERAEAQDMANGKPGNEVATRRSAGWRSLRDLGVHKATLDALVQAGKVETQNAPGMAHMPESGKLYRIKRERE